MDEWWRCAPPVSEDDGTVMEDEEGVWIEDFRFAVEGVTQSVVGVIGIVGENDIKSHNSYLFFIFETKMFYCYCRQLTVHSSTESTRHGPEANLSSDPDSPHLLRFFLYCLQSSPIQPAPFVSELSAACFPFYSALRPSPGTNRTNRQVRLICNFSLCLLKKPFYLNLTKIHV